MIGLAIVGAIALAGVLALIVENLSRNRRTRAPRPHQASFRLLSYLPLAIVLLGAVLGLGLGLSEAPTPSASRLAPPLPKHRVEVILRVSLTVPMLVGDNVVDAEVTLAQLGLQSTARSRPSSTVPAGAVIAQSPGEGSSVMSGSTVSLTVSTGQSG